MEDLSTEIRKLQAEANQGIEESNSMRHALDIRRGQGQVSKAANGLQRFLSCFFEFLNAYSGIVECVKAADSQFGGLAYGTLAIFLKMAVGKQNLEDHLENEIEHLTRYFPRLTTWKDIYPSNELKTEGHIAHVYTEIILFSREAIEYYCLPTWRRLAAGSRPNAPIEKRIQDIRERLAEIRTDCEVLMHKRIHTLSSDIQRLKTLLEKQEEHDDAKSLFALSQVIGLSEDRPDKPQELGSYEALLRSVFEPYNASPATVPPPMTWQILSKDQEFLKWLNRDSSTLLVISGYSWEGFSNKTLSWLSSAAVLNVRKLQEQEKLVASVFCQDTPTMVDNNRVSLAHMFGDLILQIVHMCPEYIRLHGGKLDTKIRGDKWNSGDEGIALESMCGIITEVLAELGSENTVYLVIDRIDQCFHQPESRTVEVPLVLFHLLQVVKSATCKVKILVISGPQRCSLSSITEQAGFSEREGLGDLYLERGGWHQDFL